MQSQTVNLSAGPGAQTVCNGSPIANIAYTVAGTATAASITAGSLPAGVTGTFAGNTFTISGTPTVTGLYNFTVSTPGTCSPASISGTITVQEQSIVNTSGSISQTKGTVMVSNGSSAKSIQLSNEIAGGRYHLTVTAPGGTKYNQTIIME